MTKIKEIFKHRTSARKHHLTIPGYYIPAKEKIPNFPVLGRAAYKFELKVLETPHTKGDYPKSLFRSKNSKERSNIFC